MLSRWLRGRHRLSSQPVHLASAQSKQNVPPGLPAFPVIGSAISLVSEYGDIPTHMREMYRGNYKKFMKAGQGVYTMGLPGLGDGLTSKVYVVSNPHEFLPVIQNEGKHPSGVLEALWPASERLKRRRDSNALFERGEAWKQERNVVQLNLLSPQIAKGYLPGIVEAARLASRGAAHSAHAFDEYAARVSFDLFNSAFFGRLAKTADLTRKDADPRDVKFCQDTLDGFEYLVPVVLSPLERLLVQGLNLSTKRFDAFCSKFDDAQDRCAEIVDDFIARKQRGELDEREMRSYVSKTLEWYEQEARDISFDQVKNIFFILLTAAVDTTSSIINWSMINLALNPDVQEKLRAEIQQHLQEGDVASIILKRREEVPYLHAFIRETHRLTPSAPVNLLKNTNKALTIYGYEIPAGSKVLLDSYSMGNDAALVEQPEKFLPERFLPDMVEMRKGTAAEMIDHPLCSGPFSAGARKCPGSRVATFEAMAMIITLLNDWKIELNDPSVNTYEDVGTHYGAILQPKPMPKLKFSELR